MSYCEDVNKDIQFQPKERGAMITDGTASGQVVIPWEDVPKLVRMLLRWQPPLTEKQKYERQFCLHGNYRSLCPECSGLA